jgi:hypothetical protein
MGLRSSQAPPARMSGVAETNSREWESEVCCTLYTHDPKCTASAAPLRPSRCPCRRGWCRARPNANQGHGEGGQHVDRKQQR